MQESRSILRSVGGKHIARILPVAIITCFPLIALSLHVQPGDLPSYSSILVNARCCVQVVNCCFGSSVLTLARFFLLPLWQLLLVFAGFWWLLLPAAGLCLLLLASACSCWRVPTAAGFCLLLDLPSFLVVTLVTLKVVRKGACVLLDLDRTSIEPRSDPAWLCIEIRLADIHCEWIWLNIALTMGKAHSTY